MRYISLTCHFQPLLQRDFISQLAKRGMSELAKSILGYLDADSLRNAEQVDTKISKKCYKILCVGVSWVAQCDKRWHAVEGVRREPSQKQQNVAGTVRKARLGQIPIQGLPSG